MKPRPFFLTLITICALLFSFVGGSLYWILDQSPLALLRGSATNNPIATVFVPQQAPVMISLLVNPDRLESLQQFLTPLTQRGKVLRELNQLKGSVLANTGLNYRRDIQPWLGNEVTFAVTDLDFDRDPNNGVKPGYLVALRNKDPELAREFLQLAFSKQALTPNSKLGFGEYQGVKFVYKPASERSGGFATGVIGDFVLFANHPRVLRDAINNVQVRDLNLRNSTTYQQALKTIEDPGVGIAFVNIPGLTAWLAQEAVPENPEVEQLFTTAFSLNRQGVIAKTAFTGVKGNENSIPALSEPVGALAYTPMGSIFTAAGTNLNQLWTEISTGLDQDSPLQLLLTQAVIDFQRNFGLDLPEAVFAWVEGEYSFSLLPHGQQNPDWVFVAEKPDSPILEQAITHLDELAQDQGFSLNTLSLAETEITAWTKLGTSMGENSFARLSTELTGVHGSIGDYEILATSVSAIDQALQGREQTLLNRPEFQEAIAALPAKNDGYLYIEWQECKAFFEEKIPLLRVIELTGQSLFENLKALTLSSQGSSNGIRRATIFFDLG